MKFELVDQPTATLVVQYPNSSEMFVCKVTFKDDLEFATLQATFAIKEQIITDEEKRCKEKKMVQDLLNKLAESYLSDMKEALNIKEKEEKNDDTL